jgi:tetratricopeptide (TPR) repeat protein
LGFFWEFRSHWYEAYESLMGLVEQPTDAPPLVRAKAFRFAAVFAEYVRDLPRAQAFCAQSLAAARESSDTSSIAWALCTDALYVQSRVNPDRAVALFEEALGLFREVGDAWGLSHTLRRLGIILMLGGEYARARPLIEEALAGARDVGDQNALAWSLFLFANVIWLQDGDVSQAITLLEEALRLTPAIRDWGNRMWVLFTLGAAERTQGNYARAEACYQQVVALMRDRQVSAYLNWPELLAGALVGLAGIAAGQRKPARAARLFGAASHVADPAPPMFFRVDREGDTATAREQLGEAAFAAAFREGQVMNTAQAIALALAGKRSRRLRPDDT